MSVFFFSFLCGKWIIDAINLTMSLEKSAFSGNGKFERFVLWILQCYLWDISGTIILLADTLDSFSMGILQQVDNLT